MIAPLIHIFSAAVKPGQLEGYRTYTDEHVAFVEAKHPRLLAFHLYLSEDARRISTVQVHPDAASMDHFMTEVIPAHAEQAYAYLEQGTERSDAFGALSAQASEQIRSYGVPLELRPQHLGGFTRLAAG